VRLPHLRSLRAQLLLAGLLLQVTLLGGYFLLTTNVLRTGMASNLQVAAKQTAEIINLAAAPYAADGRLQELEEFFQELIGESSNGLAYLLIDGEQGQRLLSAGKVPRGPLPDADDDVQLALERGILHQRQAVLLAGNQVGVLQFGLATGDLLDVLHNMIRLVLLLNLAALVLASAAISLFGQRFDQRLNKLMRAADALAAGDYQLRATEHGHDELTRLAQNFNRMAEAVSIREKKFTSVFNAAPLPMLVLRQEQQQMCLEQSNSAAQSSFGALPANLLEHASPAWQCVHHALQQTNAEQAINAQEISLPEQGGVTRPFLLSAQQFELPQARYQIITLTNISALRDSQDQLHQLNNNLEQRIHQRTQELAGRNQELANALANLQQMQEQLVQADKLASLGSIVAAVAHELNTPIGNALTVASTLQQHYQAFNQSIGQGLRRSVLDEFLQQNQHGCDMLLRNLERAAELVSSFKAVAVDRTSCQRRLFALATVIDETLLTLRPTLKQHPYLIDCEIAAGIQLDSYPGALGQIISNLINNAITHAFAGREHGLMRLRAQLSDHGHLELSFSDDGCGIAAENLKRIFDPFFTTRLGQGGSGLGLNIVYNLISGPLGGSIRVDSALAVGTVFTLRLPLRAPIHPELTHV
jgi:signal transduction histidine kinase/HAMP domain-containing protein